MWNTNKHCFIFLIIGGLVLLGLHLYLSGQDPVLAQKVSYSGFCLLLFGGGVISWVMARSSAGQDQWYEDEVEDEATEKEED